MPTLSRDHGFGLTSVCIGVRVATSGTRIKWTRTRQWTRMSKLGNEVTLEICYLTWMWRRSLSHGPVKREGWCGVRCQGVGERNASLQSSSTKHVERCRDERDTCLTIATTFAAATGAWSRVTVVLEVDSDGLPRHHVSGARDGAVAALVVDRERGAGLGSVRRVRQGTQGGECKRGGQFAARG